MQKKLMRSIIDKINAGNSKNQIFHEIIREHENVSPEEVAKKLRYIPTLDRKRKFISLIWTVVLLLVFLISMQFYYQIQSSDGFSGYFILVVLLTVFIVIGASGGNAIFFSIISFLGIGHFASILIRLTNESLHLEILLITELIVTLFLIILAFFLRVKFESKYRLPTDESILDSTDLIVFND